ncbi:mitosis inhibitor protein kinase [Cladorrhinum samala]|uniref:Mitosis inhibitor protein kinase n=1 Tax=Cladorrhinum samala TaxID=585594 RepID=A0AAV9HSQ6_9PEZI|nr:mitosis inhibitor protein kinase [Cladorrhinum samala]
MSYSSGSGGTLTLPSPTHVDVSSAVRSLRRSLSRSPSKFRLSGAASPTPASSTSFCQSPTPQRSAQFESFASAPIPATPATLAGPSSPISFSAPPFGSAGTPLRPSSSIKLSVRSSRSSFRQLARPLSRSRASPKSPLKRVFGSSPDSGNPIASTPPGSNLLQQRGQENRTFGDFAIASSPSSRRNLEKASRHSMHLDVSGSSTANRSPFPPISVSPLKRSDATMSLGQASSGSPVAKRRSLHAPSSEESDPDTSQQTPVAQKQHPGFDIHEDGSHEYQLTGSAVSPFRDLLASPSPSAVGARRSSSLRKSTIHQRYGDTRSSWGRRTGEKQLAQIGAESATPTGARNRPRLSLDQYLPPEERASPFNNQPPLSNPSVHFLQPRPANQPHPLSRSLTQSSSGSSLPDDSPTHFPIQFEKPRPPLNFSKSLPPGAQRPINNSEDVSTPNYRQAKPLAAAFMTTGLVSKMSRNPELAPLKQAGKGIAPMPDTPCKKQYNSATYPPQFSGGRRSARVSFGSPSTPFGSSGGRLIRGGQDKSSLFFQQVRATHMRKSSLLSLDGDDIAPSNDDFPPPTPTKNILFRSTATPGHPARTPANPFRGFDTPAPPIGLTFSRNAPESDTPPGASSPDEEEGTVRPSTPFSKASPFMSISFPSIGENHRQPASFATPAPSRTAPLFFPTLKKPANQSPHTPRDSNADMPPPDSSSLFISRSEPLGRSIHPPATPTTQDRQVFPNLGEPRLSITPQNGHTPSDIDESLVARFDKSEIIGSGEFSRVYRVTKSSVSNPWMITATSTTPRTPSTPASEKVYAVKKLRVPMHGIKDRTSRLKEVTILQSLSQSNRVIQYIDSWEYNSQLYIQTEFCSEGSLDHFLQEVGQGGRLDDFRVWKIMLEIAEGLAAIHDAGYIHLDIKPENVLVSFDGSLKIADFGMATTWPAPKGIEGEGDRKYISPEILHGQYDKPADIFALGLIIFEIACNVELPENGPIWQALRNADMSAVPQLTCPEAASILRDVNGLPIEHSSPIQQVQVSGVFPFETPTHDPSNLFGSPKRTELRHPPKFMEDFDNPHSLDNTAKWMIQPNPADRPTAQQLLSSPPVSWVAKRRRCGATVYEGNWGPHVGSAVEGLVETEMSVDTEMSGC